MDGDGSITFGPGVQRSEAAEGTAAAPSQPDQEEQPGPDLDEGGPLGLARAFNIVPPPLVEVPPRVAPKNRARTPASTTTSRPKSTCLAANKSSIPVTKRAQVRLIKELQFVAPDAPVFDKVLAEYLNIYKQTLPTDAITAIRKATRLSNKKVTQAMEAVAGAEDMGVAVAPA